MNVTDFPLFDRARRGLLPFLGLASGASVATIYYNQPLLLEITRTFHVSPARAEPLPLPRNLATPPEFSSLCPWATWWSAAS